MYNIILNFKKPKKEKKKKNPRLRSHNIPVSSYLIPRDLGFLHE